MSDQASSVALVAVRGRMGYEYHHALDSLTCSLPVPRQTPASFCHGEAMATAGPSPPSSGRARAARLRCSQEEFPGTACLGAAARANRLTGPVGGVA